ncbi:FGGY family carbohydrate kinase [Aeromicrobium chenweiae]|uniref:Glycerol kinase n=1 Tax=Aeromicrobium chenweiae TaxID=2079793 RepID=A0A2S0WJW7_9ACTN|nr:FGGY family carbohydrate kinase [Aeromicrobium chenweiae]AWB91635.1 glycerol kinase [Aeromicrobium chenweiae]TGN32474.1 glycerol kinase [Aeromicrobium chenweiae]
MAKFVGAIDQGTTSTRFMIFDHDGHEVARHQLGHEQIRPQDGWVEHDPHEIWEATQDVVEGALGRAGITADDLAAVGITNQRETVVVWDRRTGEPYCHAIVWQDTRTEATVAGRIRWVLDNVEDVRPDANAGHAILGTMDSWLIWWLTGGPDGGRHVTDVTNAARTMLMDLETLDWDDDLLARLEIPRSMLPEVRSSSEVYGTTSADSPFGGEVPVAGDLADRQAALVGQVCFRPGDLRSSRGAEDLLVLNTGTDVVRSSTGSATTVAYRLGDAPAVYALEAVGGGPDAIDAMVAAAGLDLAVLRVDGTATSDDQSMQVLADVLGVPVSRPVVGETATLGAAYAAGLAVGFWSGTDELVARWKESRRWEPAAGQGKRVD